MINKPVKIKETLKTFSNIKMVKEKLDIYTFYRKLKAKL